MLGLEAFIEATSDAFRLESLLDLVENIREPKLLLLIEPELDGFEALDEPVSRLPDVELPFPAGNRLARLAPNPLPNLSPLRPIGVDDEMLLRRLRHLVVDLEARRSLRNRIA